MSSLPDTDYRNLHVTQDGPAAHIVLNASGGNGAIREVCEMILQAKGHWAEILKKYEIQ